jgi:hypothetical protein
VGAAFEPVDVGGEVVGGGAAADDCGDGGRAAAPAQVDNILGFCQALVGRDGDLHVHRAHHVQPVGGLQVVGHRIVAVQNVARAVEPREAEALEVPEVLVGVDDGNC